MQRLRNLTIFPVQGRVSTQKHHKHPQKMQVEQRQPRPQFAALHSSGPRTWIKTRTVHMKSLALIVFLARSDATKCKLALLSAPPRRSDLFRARAEGHIKHLDTGRASLLCSLTLNPPRGLCFTICSKLKHINNFLYMCSYKTNEGGEYVGV